MMGLDRTRLRRWIGSGLWAVVDQGIFGASNFFINILLVLWISPEAYGGFAVAFTVLVLIHAFHEALIVEPMLVYGPARYKECFETYLAGVFCGHVAFSTLPIIVLLGISYFLSQWGSPILSNAFFGLALASPFILFFNLMRRACYVRDVPQTAASGGLLYTIVMFAGVYVLQLNDQLTVARVFYMMGGAGVVAGLLVAARLKTNLLSNEGQRLLREAAQIHWAYGRWAAATRVPMRGPEAIILMVLPLWGGLAAAGAYKALINLMMPVLRINAALSVLLIATLARYRERPGFFKITRVMLIVFFAGSAGYWLLLGVFNQQAMEWIYAGQFGEYARFLWILGLQPILAGGVGVLGAALRANEQPDAIFWAYVASASLGVPCTLALIALIGLPGAVIGTVSITGLTLAGMARAYGRLSKAPARKPVPSVVR